MSGREHQMILWRHGISQNAMGGDELNVNWWRPLQGPAFTLGHLQIFEKWLPGFHGHSPLFNFLSPAPLTYIAIDKWWMSHGHNKHYPTTSHLERSPKRMPSALCAVCVQPVSLLLPRPLLCLAIFAVQQGGFRFQSVYINSKLLT